MRDAIICGGGGRGWPDVGNGENPCCESSALNGPQDCTCWEPVHDLEQAAPRRDVEPGARTAMCTDCAYRANSPERTGDPDAAGDTAQLVALVETGQPFWCHQGMRRPVKWRHPSGAEVDGMPHDYQPPIINGVPYKASGEPGDLCGGWLLRRLAHVQRDVPKNDSDQGREYSANKNQPEIKDGIA